MQCLISSKEAYSYLPINLSEVITARYLYNIINQLSIYVLELPIKPITLHLINILISLKVLGLIIMHLNYY
jgi:hypothetical protein